MLRKTISRNAFLLVIYIVFVNGQRGSHSSHDLYGFGHMHPPCAWIERGGFFSIKEYFPHGDYLVQLRHDCTRGLHCPKTWLSYDSDRTITFKLMGVDDIREYEFQAHFCHKIFDYTHRVCLGVEGETAYELRQKGTWIFLTYLRCRCLTTAEPIAYLYSRPVHPNDKLFRANYMRMGCIKHPVCEANAVCYQETPDRNGMLSGGKPICTCPKKQFCPLYYINDKREPVYNGRSIEYYQLRCIDRTV